LIPAPASAGGAPGGLLEHLLQEIPVHIGGVPGRLGAIAHSDQHPIAFRMEMQGGLEIDRHRVRAGNCWKGAGDSDMAPVRQHRNLQPGHAADGGRPGASAVEQEPGGNLAGGSKDALDAPTGHVDAGHLHAFFQPRAVTASRRRPPAHLPVDCDPSVSRSRSKTSTSRRASW